MNSQEKFDRFVTRYPHDHTWFWKRPEYSRRQWIQALGAGVAGYFAHGPANKLFAQQVWSASVRMQSKAKNLIFVLMGGAPSHVDTFDLKEVAGVTPTSFQPETLGELRFPVGLLPRTAEQMQHIAIVRSMRSWSAVHGLAQTWTQIGRNPVSALGRVAPHMGSIVAIEKSPEKAPTQVFPAFLGLNVATNSPGQGYLPSAYAPFRTGPSAAGLGNTTHPAGAARFGDRFTLLHELDDPLRQNSPMGRQAEDMDAFYSAARGLMYNPTVDNAFRYTAAESQRYGNTGFGNACLTAKQVLAANMGTRFVQINVGGWDHHSNIYAANVLPTLARTFDSGFATLISDLAASGLLDETLIVAMGEFGRTVGPLSPQGGRDHFLQQFVLFAGAGIKGGRAIGATNPSGAFTIDSGWGRQRDIRMEDVEATMYSALGINWTTIRYDDPFRRGFEYVPFAREDVYGPIDELWA